MRAMLKRLWVEECAAVVSAEIMLVATILVIGMIVGLKSVRDSVTTELADVAAAFDSANVYGYNQYGGWNQGWGGQGGMGGGGGNWGGGGSSMTCIDTAASAGQEG